MYCHFSFSDELPEKLHTEDEVVITSFLLNVITAPFFVDKTREFNGKFLTAVINGYIPNFRQYAVRVDNDFTGQVVVVIGTTPFDYVDALMTEYGEAVKKHPELFPDQEEPIQLTQTFLESLFDRPLLPKEAIVISTLLSNTANEMAHIKFADITRRGGERFYFMLSYSEKTVEGSPVMAGLKGVQFDAAGIIKH